MDLIAVPAFADNLIWILHDGQQALVVDPGEASPVIETLQALRLRLGAILVTHHHADHVGGVAALLARLEGTVHGPAREVMPVPVCAVRGGDHFELLGTQVSVFDLPGHTAGHVAYLVVAPGQPGWLFCGDTLFSGGCGRLFEGTPAQMLDSLTRLAALPGDTRVCCAHEYTLSNLRFARVVEPHNTALSEYEQHCQALRAEGAWTLPSTIATERAINPFLRTDAPEVIAAARGHGAAASDRTTVLTTLRAWKNTF